MSALLAVFLTMKVAVFVRFAMAIRTTLVSNERARPAVLAITVMGAMFMAISLYLDLGRPTSTGWLLAGLMLVLAAGATFEAALRAAREARLGFAFSGIEPARIVTRGPYRLVRHPLYASYTLFWLGCLAVSPHPVLFAIFAALVGIYIAAAIGEERQLSSVPEYAAYRARSAMIVPFVL